MTLQLSLAEKFLAPTFVSDGWSAFRNPADQTTFSETTLKRMASAARLPEDPEVVIKMLGALQMTAGALLFLGKFRRLSSAALALSLVPSTFGKPTGGAFGLADTPAHPGTGARARSIEQRAAQRKNMALLGGLALVFTDLGGAPSLSWRAARNLKKAKVQTGKLVDGVGQRIGATTATSAAPLLEGLKPRLDELTHLAASAAHRVGDDASELGSNLSSNIGGHVGDLRGLLGQIGERVGTLGEQIGDRVVQLGDQLGSHAVEAGSHLADLGRAGSAQLVDAGGAAAHRLEHIAPAAGMSPARLAGTVRSSGRRFMRRHF